MDDRTRSALEGSIRKWEAIVAGTGEDKGPHNCPLCAMFFSNPECAGCPVAARTGQDSCNGSPYKAWLDRGGANHSCRATTEELVALAQAELDFLKSLREEVAYAAP